MTTDTHKYSRSLHARISLGTTSDDRFMPKGYLQTFAQMSSLVITEKLDGQNNCFSKRGLFARSHGSPTMHPWDKPLRQRWELIKNDLGDLEIFGENMYGIHSVAYQKLESFFYVFGVRENGRWLSWEQVCQIANRFDFPTVPQIEITHKLDEFMTQSPNEDIALAKWLEAVLGMPWEAYVKTSGALGGYDPKTQKPSCEGLVIRDANSFTLGQGGVLAVMPNEFGHLFKIVRQGHVQTDVHWTKNWKPATLIDYEKYQWYAYAYRSEK